MESSQKKNQKEEKKSHLIYLFIYSLLLDKVKYPKKKKKI